MPRRKVKDEAAIRNNRRQEFANALADLPCPVTLGEPEYQEAILLAEKHGLTTGDFIALDEKPGQFLRRNEWHRKLRQVRNNCPRFFRALIRRG